jgi:hypothetical protein
MDPMDIFAICIGALGVCLGFASFGPVHSFSLRGRARKGEGNGSREEAPLLVQRDDA